MAAVTWEELAVTTVQDQAEGRLFRAQVTGGWLVMHQLDCQEHGKFFTHCEITFVADVVHAWSPDTL